MKDYCIENEYIKATVTTWGAQLKSVVRKCDGVEHIWQACEHWKFYAPICFPYAGKVTDGEFEIKGKKYPARVHGFARDYEHTLLEQTEDSLSMELIWNGDFLKEFPYKHRLISTFTLDKDTVHHTLTVENLGDEKFPFGVGFHPGFAVPFDEKHKATDYEFRFSEMESPLCLDNAPSGLLNGKVYGMGSNLDRIPLNEHLFDNDSYCMFNLRSDTLGIYEKNSGRGVEVSIAGFPYVLIWSKPGMPRFVCIEPWESLPSAEGSSLEWGKKPAAAILNPGEAWSTTLSTRYVR